MDSPDILEKEISKALEVIEQACKRFGVDEEGANKSKQRKRSKRNAR